ncbi:MAG: ribose 5-phosphate isomerase A, partial [Gemmataceae bacterium]|nr:ribose 5-phosphate isomerase A [Gemmataceae bacterium]
AFVRELGKRVAGGLRVRGVPTSEATARLASECGIPLAGLEAMPLALTVDGADEVSPDRDLIKGLGRALLREKAVASASDRLVILLGQSKKVGRLGARGKLPVEALPFALPLVRERIGRLGLSILLDERDGRPFVTDNGNWVLDILTGPIPDPRLLDHQLRDIAGVAGTGLFLGMDPLVLVGDEDRGFALLEELGGTEE